MSIKRAFKVFIKDLQLGPRSPIFLWAIILPFVLTFLIQIVFGGLFEAKPRLGIVDKGSSEITESVKKMEEIEVTIIESTDKLKDMVRNNNLDAGLILKEGFDEEIRAGNKPELEFYISGESLASDRIILAVSTLDLVREVEGSPPPVEVVVEQIGEGAPLPIAKRLVPLILMYALIAAGALVPAFNLVEEREQKTLDAALVTPLKMSEMLFAKSSLGFTLAMLMSVATLALNNALGNQPLALLLSLAVGALMCAEFGLILATSSTDTKTLFGLFKSLGILILAPVIFYIFPEWPRWIAKLFPTYWFLNPIFEISFKGFTLGDIWFELLIALLICVVLLPFIILLGRRMQLKLST